MAWAVAAVLLRSSIPWFFWFTTAALPCYAAYNAEKDFFRRPVARKILFVCVGVFALHLAWAMGRATFYDANSTETYWRDDYNYYREAAAIAEAWKTGYYPDISLKGSPPYLGTIHTGYHRPLALLFMVTGPSTLTGLLLNALCAGMMPLLAALCARYLWQKDLLADSVKGFNSFAWKAALFVALQPNQFYWASYLMKDTFTAMAFMAALTLTAGAFRRRDPGLAVASILILPFLFSVRAYAAFSIVVGAGGLLVLGLPRRRVAQVVISGTVIVFLLCAYTTAGAALYRQLRDSFAALAPGGNFGAVTVLKQVLAGIPRLFLAPYSWLFVDKPTPMVGLYPGMWYLYLVIWPLGVCGMAVAIRRNVKLAALPLAALGVGALIFLSSSYAGNASRQRYYLEPVFALFAVYGLANPSKWWIGAIFFAEAAFAVGQLLSLR